MLNDPQYASDARADVPDNEEPEVYAIVALPETPAIGRRAFLKTLAMGAGMAAVAGAVAGCDGNSRTTLSSTSVSEHLPSGSMVGGFTTADPSGKNKFTYTLVNGGTDNAWFRIVGNTLRTAGELNYDQKSSYRIHVKTTDTTGVSFETAFTIYVRDVSSSSDSGSSGSDASSDSGSSGYSGGSSGYSYTYTSHYWHPY